MEDIERNKKFKTTPSSEEIKQVIQNTKTPLVFKNTLTWDLLHWSLEDWVEKLGNPKLSFRIGTKKCTKVPQWESNCPVVSGTLNDLLDDANASSDTWMYFDYKHMNQHFKTKTNLLEVYDL
uniref:Uncharacterized protein n=1 Tax=Homalodisca liturata TaxID=320908 RepID=A0A1B6JIN3_9HEMI